MSKTCWVTWYFPAWAFLRKKDGWKGSEEEYPPRYGLCWQYSFFLRRITTRNWFYPIFRGTKAKLSLVWILMNPISTAWSFLFPIQSDIWKILRQTFLCIFSKPSTVWKSYPPRDHNRNRQGANSHGLDCCTILRELRIDPVHIDQQAGLTGSKRGGDIL